MEMWGQAVTWLNNLPNVPFPQPGAPYNNTARGLEAEKLAATTLFNCERTIRLCRRPASTNTARPRSEALVVPHDQLSLNLVYRVHGHTHDEKQGCATEVEVHVKAVQYEARKIRINPIANQGQVLKFNA